ncbi:MAG: hypothetical protein L0Y64_18185 [Myxococcaceae bacterium]|nr:hypothetical protein [Myxococcaceae bacterium]
MSFKHWVLAGALSVAGQGCATTGSAGGQEQSDFQKSGEVVVTTGGTSGSASFDARRVVGPNVNVSRRDDGSWAGPVNGQFYSFTMTPGRIAAANFTLSYEETPTGVTMNGYIQGRMFRFEVNDTQLVVRTASGRSLTLPRYSAQEFGQSGNVKFLGEASQQNPPMPQLAFALLGAFGG